MSTKRKIVIRAYLWPVVSTVITLIPGLNVMLFGTGLGAILIMACFPWFLIQLFLPYTAQQDGEKSAYRFFAVRVLLSYVLVTFPLSLIGAYGVLSTRLHGADASFWRFVLDFWGTFFFPLSLVLLLF